MEDRKSVQLDTQTHGRLKEAAGKAGLTINSLVASLLNIIDNRVAYAKEFEGVAKVPKAINPFMTDEDRAERGYSDYKIFVALYLLEIGAISQEQFDAFKGEDITHLVTIRASEFVEKLNLSRNDDAE